ncbi:MAG: TRAP transporter large permease subunit, partial [candidate division NC10 bacterium]|nr:TRAP transporter large permease subunit [candidate division NC10 bacterium]
MRNVLSAIQRAIDGMVRWLVIVLMLVMTLAVSAQILFRYVFNIPLGWSEEMARFAFVWVSFIGASALMRAHHQRVDPVGPGHRNPHGLGVPGDPGLGGADGDLGRGPDHRGGAPPPGGAAPMTLIIFFGVFFVTLILSAPIVFSLALSALALLWNKGMLVPQLVVQRMFAGIDSFPMMAIPFFMLAGSLMDTGGISTRLVRFSNYLVGWIQGGLAHVAILASMFFAGITGSAVADATAIGSTLIPLMNKRGFPTLFSASVVAAAGVVGPIIPPSIPMVIYGVMAGVSIGALFMGGLIPGILVGLGLMVVAYVKAKRHGYPRETVRPTVREFLQATVSAFGAILMPLIILGGIFGGVFTATEAAVVATV